MTKTKFENCLKCNKGKHKVIIHKEDDGVRVSVYNCDNKECNHQTDLDKLMNDNRKKTTN